MSSLSELHQDQKPEISLSEGGHGFCIRTFLAREPSLNQSSDLFYRESEAGIPFKWEKQPGTPKVYICPQQDGLISTPPLSPSPVMQSLKLRLPDHDETKGSTLKSSKVKSFKKMVQKSIASNRDRFQKEYSSRFGELMESAKNSSVSSSSSSSFSIPWKDRGLDSSRDSMFDAGSGCRKGNFAAILLQDHEENRGAIPRQEMQPDTPKGPPLAVHSSYLPPPRPRDGGEKLRDSTWTKKALFWIKGSGARRKLTQNVDKEISFRRPENMEILDSVEEFDDLLCHNMSKSSPTSESNGNFEALKMKRASYFSTCGSWKGMKRDSCVCSKKI